MSRCFLIISLFLIVNCAWSQFGEVPSIHVKRTVEEIIIDGELNETTWTRNTPSTNFWQYFPTDSLRAKTQTEISMAYDGQNLYVAVKCLSIGNDYVVPSLRRDYQAGGSDNISIMFDPFDDRTNAFLFGLNPYGVQREALLSNGGQDYGRDWDDSWDNKWEGEAKVHDGFWVAEFAIPFSTLRFKEGSTKWNFNAYRFDTQSNENSLWVRIPRNQILINMGYMGEMIWDEPLKKTGKNISIIPYVASSVVEDREAGIDTKLKLNAGGDAKIAITSGLNLDLTFNPDFSQVEVDRQVTNLDRFEIFFPERRQFFLENSDLFSSFGARRISPFFSRRIGIVQDLETETNIENPIIYGAKLSGKLNRDWRVGLLNMQTAQDERNDLPSFNYTVAAVQRRVFKRSNVGLIFVNKQSIGKDSSEIFSPYNRVVGVDYNHASEDNTWVGKFFLHKAFTTSDIKNKIAHGARLKYNKRNYQIEWVHRWVGEGYDAEVGFVPRSNFYRINPEVRLNFFPQKKLLNRHSPVLGWGVFWKPEFGRTDHEITFSWNFRFTNNNNFSFRIVNNYTYLFDPFDPSGTDAVDLEAETDYNYTSISARYQSDRRKKFSYFIQPIIGQFFNGNRYGLRGEATYRYQPFGSIAINFNYNHIELPSPYATADLFLIGPRIDLTFTKNVFLTTFIQYNNQIDNININARFQWRFKPVSDFFIVYTDNYDTNLNVKNRALIAKFTYWLNL